MGWRMCSFLWFGFDRSRRFLRNHTWHPSEWLYWLCHTTRGTSFVAPGPQNQSTKRMWIHRCSFGELHHTRRKNYRPCRISFPPLLATNSVTGWIGMRAAWSKSYILPNNGLGQGRKLSTRQEWNSQVSVLPSHPLHLTSSRLRVTVSFFVRTHWPSELVPMRSNV